jgi:geranylgeranyl diphosphate synthase type I
VAPGLAGMMRYQFGFADEEFRQIRRPAGKRFRPLLSLLVCEACGTPWRNALNVAVAIELLHNFSLIHDDIEDGDSERHHRPTVWKLWGMPQALNAGDAMFALAGGIALGSAPTAELSLLIGREFQRTALTLTDGQYRDMSFQYAPLITPNEYISMISKKTGSLVEFCAWAGAAVATADADTAARLGNFGRAVGCAFQIRDDVMGIWGTAAETGKEPASDVRNRKQTLPVLLALEELDDARRRVVVDHYSGRTDCADAVVKHLSGTSARQQSLVQCSEYLADGLRVLRDLDLKNQFAAELERLAHRLAGQ